MEEQDPIDGYLIDLQRRLRLLGAECAGVVEEMRSHLLDAAEREQHRGLPRAAAQQRAVAAFGDPRELAARFLVERSRARARTWLPVALLLGLTMAFVDSRPTWDDTGISALAVVLTTGILGMLDPIRPWLWALAIGVWFPMAGIVVSGNYGAVMALGVAVVGAYAGGAARRAFAAA